MFVRENGENEKDTDFGSISKLKMESLVESSFDDQDVIPETPPEPRAQETRFKWRKKVPSESENSEINVSFRVIFNILFSKVLVDFQESPIKESEEEEDDEDNDSADDSVIRPKTTAKKSQVLSDSEEVRTNQSYF